MALRFLFVLVFVLSWCACAHADTQLSSAIFEVLHKLPVSKFDATEPVPERDARFQALSEEIAKYPREAIALVTLAAEESALAGYVGRGECDNPPPKAPNCDRDSRRKVARARTYFQLHELTCPEAWKETQGSRQELAAAVACAARTFKRAYRKCSGQHALGNLAGAFAGYRQLTRCTFLPMGERVMTYRRVDRLLEKAWGKRLSVYSET